MNDVTPSDTPPSRVDVLKNQLSAWALEIGVTLEFTAAKPRELGIVIGSADWLKVAKGLRDHPAFRFDTLIDASGIDYLHYGREEWQTHEATKAGFGRSQQLVAELKPHPEHAARFAVSYQLLSVERNQRLRVRVYATSSEPPMVDSIVDIWPSANWFEREAFDLYGIFFKNHPDLRRILTDYGFVGHPFRKDFPVSGHVEVRYDPAQKRVVYEPVSIEPRTLVPRVIRDDHRLDPLLSAKSTPEQRRG